MILEQIRLLGTIMLPASSVQKPWLAMGHKQVHSLTD